jgi:hypothetical protein
MKRERCAKASLFISLCFCILTECAAQNSVPTNSPATNAPALNPPYLTSNPNENIGATNDIQKITGFPSYDEIFFREVSKRWHDLLNSRKFHSNHPITVIVLFHLNSDGSVSEMRFLDWNTDESLGLICEDAILGPPGCSPFPRWWADMKEKLGESIEVKFTFNYNGK